MKMREFLISLEARLLRRDLQRAFKEPAGQPAETPPQAKPEWTLQEEERTRRYIDTMLERIERFSHENRDAFEVPETLYHASVYTGLPMLDPEYGQGLGVWFQDNLIVAADIGVFRCREPSTGEPYPGYKPSIYEAKLGVKKFAVFPDEGSLYKMAIEQPGDDDDLCFKPQHLYDLHNVRIALAGAGYDGIHLLRENTFSAIDSQAITIIREHDPYVLYNTHIRPKLTERDGEDPFASVPQ